MLKNRPPRARSKKKTIKVAEKFERDLKAKRPLETKSTELTEKPRVFIGSSKEGLDLARALQVQLADIADCTIWNQGMFELGKATLANLYGFLDSFDFAVFLVTPDDNIHIRGTELATARDNVIFEIGLFMGGLGVDRVIFVGAANFSDFRLPSDLDGITHAKYDIRRRDENISTAVSSPSFEIRQHIKNAPACT